MPFMVWSQRVYEWKFTELNDFVLHEKVARKLYVNCMLDFSHVDSYYFETKIVPPHHQFFQFNNNASICHLLRVVYEILLISFKLSLNKNPM